MAGTIPGLVVRWLSDHASVLKSAAAVKTALTGTGSVARTVGSAMVTAFNAPARALGALGSAASSASSQMQASAQKFSAISNSIGNMGKSALQMAGRMEQSRTSFTNLLGSAEAAGEYIQGLQEFAARTPFTFTGIQESTKQLIAFGFAGDETLEMMQKIGDTAGALGAGEEGIARMVRAIGQVQAKGRLLTEEAMQLQEVGVPVFQILQEELGLTAEQIQNLGRQGISASDAIEAIMNGMDRYSGSMESQATTILGLWSTFTDNIEMMLVDVGNSIVSTFDLKTRLAAGLIWLQEAVRWFNSLDSSTKAIIISVGAFVALLAPALMFLGQVALGVGALAGAFAFLTPPIAAVVLAIGGIAAGLAYAWTQSEEFRSNVLAVWGAISAAGGAIWADFKAILQSLWAEISSIATSLWPPIQKLWEEHGETIKGVVSGIWDTIVMAVRVAMRTVHNAIKIVIDIFSGDWKGAWETAKNTAQLLWNALKHGADNVLKPLGTSTAAIAGAISDAWGKVKTTITDAIDGILKRLESVKQWLGNIIDLGGRARAAMPGADAGANLKNLNTDVLDAVKPIPSARGGLISGPGGPKDDAILSRLSAGEFVVQASAVKAVGLPFLSAINAAGYRDGGLVGRLLPGFAKGGQSKAGEGLTDSQVAALISEISSGTAIGASIEGMTDLDDVLKKLQGSAPSAALELQKMIEDTRSATQEAQAMTEGNAVHDMAAELAAEYGDYTNGGLGRPLEGRPGFDNVAVSDMIFEVGREMGDLSEVIKLIKWDFITSESTISAFAPAVASAVQQFKTAEVAIGQAIGLYIGPVSLKMMADMKESMLKNLAVQDALAQGIDPTVRALGEWSSQLQAGAAGMPAVWQQWKTSGDVLGEQIAANGDALGSTLESLRERVTSSFGGSDHGGDQLSRGSGFQPVIRNDIKVQVGEREIFDIMIEESRRSGLEGPGGQI